MPKTNLQINPPENRSVMLAIRITSEEKAVLEAAAEAFDSTKSGVLRAAIHGPILEDLKTLAPHLFEESANG